MKIIVTIKNIDPDVWVEARIEAIKQGITLGEYVTKALRNELEAHNGERVSG